MPQVTLGHSHVSKCIFVSSSSKIAEEILIQASTTTQREIKMLNLGEYHGLKSRFQLSSTYPSHCQHYLSSSEHHSAASSTSSPSPSFRDQEISLLSKKQISRRTFTISYFRFQSRCLYHLSPPRLKHDHPAWLDSESA